MRYTLVFPLSALTYKELEICPSCPYNKKELDKWFLLNPAESWACRENLHPEIWRYKKIQRVTAKKHLLMCNRRQWSQRWVGKIKWKFFQIAGGWAMDYLESGKSPGGPVSESPCILWALPSGILPGSHQDLKDNCKHSVNIQERSPCGSGKEKGRVSLVNYAQRLFHSF